MTAIPSIILLPIPQAPGSAAEAGLSDPGSVEARIQELVNLRAATCATRVLAAIPSNRSHGDFLCPARTRE